MENIQSDICILDNLLALNLNISLWSARRKMTPEDLGGAELPPEDLASLGSKRIADPESLRVFGALKSRAFAYLDRHGVRFLSGWAIPEEKAGSVIRELTDIRADFQKAKEDFLPIMTGLFRRGLPSTANGETSSAIPLWGRTMCAPVWICAGRCTRSRL